MFLTVLFRILWVDGLALEEKIRSMEYVEEEEFLDVVWIRRKEPYISRFSQERQKDIENARRFLCHQFGLVECPEGNVISAMTQNALFETKQSLGSLRFRIISFCTFDFR